MSGLTLQKFEVVEEEKETKPLYGNMGIGNTSNDRDSETLLTSEVFEEEPNRNELVSRKNEIAKTIEVSLNVQKIM